jgi:1-acyl-sn-glycerol-3-phosphate acyltransferase
MRDEPAPGPGVAWAVGAGIALVRVVGRWYDLEVSGGEHIPRRGPVVLAINHFSHLDAVISTYLAGRNVRYLAVDELFGESRFFDRLVGYFGAIPMSRERPPLGAMRTALETLNDGGAVGLFPEGRRVAHWGESDMKEGAAWLALRAGVPLVPVSIIGTEETLSVRERAMRRASVRAWADPPLYPTDFLDEPNPRRVMTEAWQAAVDARVAHWSSTA